MMKSLMRFHPILLIGVVMAVATLTSPDFLPDYDAGVLSLVTLMILFLLASPISISHYFLFVLGVPHSVAVPLSIATGLTLYWTLDRWVIRRVHGTHR